MLVIAAALALHAAVAWLLGQRAHVAPPGAAPVAARISLRWLPPQTLVPPAAEAATVPPATGAATPPTRSLPATRAAREKRAPASPSTPAAVKDVAPAPAQPDPLPTPDAQGSAHGATQPTTQPTGQSATLPAAQPKGGSSLADILNSPGTRRAIRDAARAPSLAELEGTTTPTSATQRLGTAIASGAYGDCEKGEFAGGGMGLLSLPFWAIARLRDHCGK
ncbi:MAG: hypothetical protein M9915_13030 [Rhizobacter sp.]|nr:hypothetical protein [Rhizobacter sp.]